MGALRDHVEDFVAGVQEELGMLDELRYEWRRLQTFVEWPLERPRPAELAKAGFFFSPCQDEPDRCAHFCIIRRVEDSVLQPLQAAYP